LKKSDKVEELYSSNSEDRKIIQPDQRHADYSAPMIAMGRLPEIDFYMSLRGERRRRIHNSTKSNT